MTTTDTLLTQLEDISPEGLQVSYRIGILNFTRAIYYYKSEIYIFCMEDDFIFRKGLGYTKAEFIEKYKDYYWLVEMTIS